MVCALDKFLETYCASHPSEHASQWQAHPASELGEQPSVCRQSIRMKIPQNLAQNKNLVMSNMGLCWPQPLQRLGQRARQARPAKLFGAESS